MTSIEEKEWVFIVNPTAGNHFAKTLVPKIKSEIISRNINATIVLTEHKGHATELALEHIRLGAKYIVAVGGDGTLNEIAKALVNNSDVVLGIIPAGTGNDFVQILGFPNRFEEKHWDIFFNRNIERIDVGKCNGIPFFNGMGLGFDAEVAARNYIGEGSVKKGGGDKYLWHIVSTLLFFREKQMKAISDNDAHETNCFINTVSIGRRFAGGFFLTPKAIANDGLLDVCMIEKLSLYHRFRILPMVPKGTHINDKRVNYFSTQNINLEFSKRVPFHVDGELYFDSSFKIGIIPKAISAIYNPDGDHFFQN
jgi:YegS/Rv2252/BmrU family lipid kinase